MTETIIGIILGVVILLIAIFSLGAHQEAMAEVKTKTKTNKYAPKSKGTNKAELRRMKRGT